MQQVDDSNPTPTGPVGDHDFVPDEWQTRPPGPLGEPAPKKKAGFFGRLFGTGESKEKVSKSGSTKKLDLSKGPIKEGLFEKSAAGFEHGVREQFRREGGSVFNAAQRKEIAKVVRKARSKGLYSGETIKDLNELREAGILKNKFQVKKARKILGAKRRPSFF